jgi:hypothetical protein
MSKSYKTGGCITSCLGAIKFKFIVLTGIESQGLFPLVILLRGVSDERCILKYSLGMFLAPLQRFLAY